MEFGVEIRKLWSFKVYNILFKLSIGFQFETNGFLFQTTKSHNLNAKFKHKKFDFKPYLVSNHSLKPQPKR